MRKLSKVLKVVGYGLLTYNLYYGIPTMYTRMLPECLQSDIGLELVPVSCLVLLVGEIVGLINKK